MSIIQPPFSQPTSSIFPPEAVPPVGYLSRKALPIKRNDAEPLTREDVQYDLLDYLFKDRNQVFTNPISGKSPKITFSDLYVSALYSSNKCSKVLKEKMVDTPAFSLEFAKISLLTNVGRINTTMAFFPEMKTALRTYHPVPSLQKTDGNAQDAPRIKNCLKAALLPSELKTAPPSTPEEVLEKRNSGIKPPTSVVNLVFILANHAAPLASVHFDGSLNFLDLFLPNKKIASADRGRAFLWLLYHYLEDDKGANPFDDAFSSQHPGKIPTLHRLSSAEYARENVDTPEEMEWGQMMSNQRNIFLQKLVSSTDKDRPIKTSAPHFVAVGSSESVYTPRATRHHSQDAKDFLFYVPSKDSQPMLPQRGSLPHHHLPQPVIMPPPNTRERTMFQQAWHVAKSVDPLVDSDEETDHHARLDYSRRLSIISRIHKTPTGPL